MPSRYRIITPGVVLFLLAPYIGEFLPGSQTLLSFVTQPLQQVLVYLALAALYGSGALIVRELVLKWGKGWVSVVLLGLAYGILEEGIVAQSFSNPTWEGLSFPASYGRVLGVNWPWVESIIIYHAAISISLSILIVALIFPGYAGRRYTSRRTLFLCFALLAFSVVFGESLYPYWSGFLYYAAAIGAILALGYLATKAPASAAPKRVMALPSWVFAVVGFIAAFLFYEIQYSLPPAVSPPLVMLTIACLAALVVLFLLRFRSRGGTAWAQYSLALGVVLYYVVWVSAFRPVSAPNSVLDVALMAYLGFRIRRRTVPLTAEADREQDGEPTR